MAFLLIQYSLIFELIYSIFTYFLINLFNVNFLLFFLQNSSYKLKDNKSVFFTEKNKKIFSLFSQEKKNIKSRKVKKIIKNSKKKKKRKVEKSQQKKKLYTYFYNIVIKY